MSDFVQLHNHSYYSLLDGMSSIKGMVSCAADMGYKALALTDHGSCTGLYQFQIACKEKGIKPILGMEGYICDDHTFKEKGATSHHIVLLAKNTVGYKNLIYLSSLANIYGFYYKPRIDFNLLSQHSEGLIVSTACCAGEIPRLVIAEKIIEAEKLAQTYKDVFKDDFYLEIMIHSYFNDKAQEEKERTVANALYEMGKKLNIKVIATQDSHYTHKEDWEAHDTLLSIQTLNTVKNPDRLTFGSNDFYLKPIEEMEKIYCSRAPEVLTNTLEIAEKVQTNLIVESSDLLPAFKVPEGVRDEEDYLKKLVEEGMRSKGLINKKEYRDRIRMEMEVIIRCKYTKYFLILWDIINYAKTQAIKIGAGRGCFLPDNKIDCKDGAKEISKIKINDEVLSYDGKYHNVLEVLDYDINEDVIEINMEDGRKISCTLDHKIHVKRGSELVWVRAEELTEQDDIYDIRGEN